MDISNSKMEEVRAKEKLKMIKMENSNLKSHLRLLEAQMNESFHVKLQKDIVDKKLSGLQMEILEKQRSIRKLKSETAKFRQEVIQKDSLLQAMAQHVKKIWILLLAFGNKLGKNGLLTIKEKNNIKNEYEEWFTLMAALDKGESEEVLKMLNELPTSLFEVLNISECESEINQPQFSNEENVIFSSELSTLKDKTSSSNKSLKKTDHTIQDKLDKKPKTVPYRKINNCNQVTQSQVKKKTNMSQRRSKQLSRINLYKAILRKNSSFSDNSLLLHSTIVSNFQSKATVKTSKKNDSVKEYHAESKRSAILIPGLPMKISKKKCVDKNNVGLEDPSLQILPPEDSSKRTHLSKSYDSHSNKRQKVSLEASALNIAPVRLRGRTLENRMISGKQNSQTESSNEITEKSGYNKCFSKVDQTLENESEDVENKSEKIYNEVGKLKKLRKENSKSFEKAISDNVFENQTEKLFDSNISDSISYKHFQLREVHENFTPSYVPKCVTTTKNTRKILEQRSLDHIPNINESPSTTKQQLLADKKIIAVNAYNKEHVSVETEHTKNNDLPQNIIPCLSFNLPSKNKGLSQTNFEILTANAESTFFNSKIPLSNKEVNISAEEGDNSENNMEISSDHVTAPVMSKNFNDNEILAVSDEKRIKNLENIKMGFTWENGNSVYDSDSECDLVIDEGSDNDMHLMSEEIHKESGEEMKMGISEEEFILDHGPDSKSLPAIAENLNAMEQCTIPNVNNHKSLGASRNDICIENDSDSYSSFNPCNSKEKTNSLGFIPNMSTFRDNYESSITVEDTECEITSTSHLKLEKVALKDFPPKQIIESSKVPIVIDYKPHSNSVNKQTNFTSPCVNKDPKLVGKTFDVGAILKLQAKTFNFKSKNKILEKDLQEAKLTFFKEKNSALKPDDQCNKMSHAQQKRKSMKKKSRKNGMDITENSMKIRNFNLQSVTPEFNRKNQILEKIFPGESNSTFSTTKNSQIKPNNHRINTKQMSGSTKRKLRRKLWLEKNQTDYTGHPVHEFFQGFKKIQFSQENFEQNVENLFLLLIDPTKTPNSSSLLFHVLNYLRKSKTKTNILLSYSACEDLSVLFPLDENCIVTTLFLIELEKKPHLEGLLNTAVTTFYHIIIFKKKFGVLILASFCRVFTQICKCQGNNLKPVLLCGDLLKMKHRFAPYLIASIASVWKELFQIGNNLPAEEVLFHSSILYGASKRTKLTGVYWDITIKIISKYFTALPVNDARSAIKMLMELIQLRCKDDSCNNHYLATALTILAAHEDWDWTEEVLLHNYIIPNLNKFGRETLNEIAFDFYCNMYVDVFLLKPGNPLDTVFTKFFDSSEVFEGGNSVQDSAAMGLMRFVYLKNRHLPSFLKSWLKKNSGNPKVQRIRPYFQRQISIDGLREEDVRYI